MKILFTGEYSKSPNDPAPLFVSRVLYEGINKSDNETLYLAYFQDGKRYNRWQKIFGFEVIDYKKNIFRCGIIPYLFQVIKYNPDVINLINIQLFYSVLFLLKPFLNFKIVYTMHGITLYEQKHFYKMNEFQKRRLFLAEYLIMKFSYKILSLSELNARYVRRYYKLKDSKTEVVPNGISIINISKEYSDDSKPSLNCYFIGNPERPEKGYPFLQEILFEEKIRMNISLFGADYSKEINHDGRVNIKIYEHIDNESLRNKIPDFDLFITASAYEPFSLALLESMSAGILFLASDRVGLTERFNDKLKNLVFRFNNKASFLSKLKSLDNLSLVEKREMSDHIKEFASGYSIKYVSDIYLKSYKRLLKENS